MALFSQDSLRDGVAMREVWSWSAFDFANSGYTTVVLTAVFNAYFVNVIAAGSASASIPKTAKRKFMTKPVQMSRRARR